MISVCAVVLRSSKSLCYQGSGSRDTKDTKDTKDAKAAKRRQKLDFEEDQKIVNVVLENLKDNLLNSFDIPSRGLEKLSSELNREEKAIQQRWKYSIRLWIKEDQENERDDWGNHGQAALDRRRNITRYFKIQTERKKTKNGKKTIKIEW